MALAQVIAQSPALSFKDVQGYAGHAMHIAGRAERRAALAEASRPLGALRDALTESGFTAMIVTGGGTGSFDQDPELNILTELQAGSYLFMDREYEHVWHDHGEPAPFENALFVQATVISASHAGYCTIDAGCKAFATEAGRRVSPMVRP